MFQCWWNISFEQLFFLFLSVQAFSVPLCLWLLIVLLQTVLCFALKYWKNTNSKMNIYVILLCKCDALVWLLHKCKIYKGTIPWIPIIKGCPCCDCSPCDHLCACLRPCCPWQCGKCYPCDEWFACKKSSSCSVKKQRFHITFKHPLH